MCFQTFINHTLCHHVSTLIDPCFTSRYPLLSSIGRRSSKSRRRHSSTNFSFNSHSSEIVGSTQLSRCEIESQQRWSYTLCPGCLTTFANAGVRELNAENTVQEWRRLTRYNGALKVAREGTDTRPRVRLEKEREAYVVGNDEKSVPPSPRAFTLKKKESAKARGTMSADRDVKNLADVNAEKCLTWMTIGDACDCDGGDIADRGRLSRLGSTHSTKCIKHCEMGIHSGGKYRWAAETDVSDLSARKASRERNFSGNHKKNGKQRKVSDKSVREERSRHHDGPQASASTSNKERQIRSNSARWTRDIEAEAGLGSSCFGCGVAGPSRPIVTNSSVEIELDENLKEKMKKEREIVNMVRAWGDVPEERKTSKDLDAERVKGGRRFVRETSFRI